MNSPTFAHLRRRACLLLVAASALALSACGGGDNPFQSLYTSITINDLSYPADEDRDTDIRIEARASSIGEISGSDIDWELEQTSGDDISNVRKELSDNNYKVIFRVTAPDQTGRIYLKIKVKANGFSDTESFSIDIQ